MCHRGVEWGGGRGDARDTPGAQLLAASEVFHICHLQYVSRQFHIVGINRFCPILWMRKLRLQ